MDDWLSHALQGPLRGNQKIVCLDTGLGIKFPFRVNGQTGQIRALDDVKIFARSFAMGTCGTDSFIDHHGIEDRLRNIEFRQAIRLQFEARLVAEDVMAGENCALDSNQNIAHDLSPRKIVYGSRNRILLDR